MYTILRIWDYIRYDIPRGIKNIFYFWNVVWNYRSWDYANSLKLFRKSLIPLKDAIEKGTEVKAIRDKKVKKIERVIEILDNITDDKYIEIAEHILGYEVNINYKLNEEPEDVSDLNDAIYNLASDIEKKEWDELYRILKGQDATHFTMILDRSDNKNPNQWRSMWEKWYDGSGLPHWWN